MSFDGLVHLPDGRVLRTFEVGSPAGSPILFFSGTPASRLQAWRYADAARSLGVRLVAFNRPGYGESTYSDPSLAAVGRDALVVADTLGVGRFAVIGVSGGGPYALATGLAGPDRVTGIGLAAGIGPWRRLPGVRDDDPELPLLARADRGDLPGAVAGFVELAERELAPLLALADEEMITEYFNGVPPEELTWLDARARREWAADLREALGSYTGYALDNVAWGGRWDIDPRGLTVPTWLWYGELDHLVPPSHGRWLADRLPNATLVVRPGMGHGRTAFEPVAEMLATLRDTVTDATRHP